ncbi:penicillin amidase [Luteimonas sp. J16]|uniref:penicillin acylase family protein n=1 Tax=unclassified Luteimonas TaxID=2629088 RepID=UPI00047E3584|nr:MULTISPECIES: penicillin acylase family protein [unclassified Luteimonas]TWG86919.1 penicillin amidase [Luteimonas sp. J16]
MRRWLWRIVLLAAVLAVLLALLAWWLLRASLPALDGEVALPGLSAPVQVQRDALGVVTIEAGDETDAMRALGFVHAQERYFEMDLLRRTAAGELSALFGPVALDLDRGHRTHRMRARVEARLGDIAGERMPQLVAYAEGANAGLAALRARPWPYLLLRREPEPWRPSDSVLAGYAMYFDLQDAANADELALWRLKEHLPPPLYALLTHPGSAWDAPLQGEPFGDATLPGPDEVDLRRLPAPAGAEQDGATTVAAGSARQAWTPWATTPPADGLLPGSNNFAVAGSLTIDGRAIVANDMHLGLRAPNVWFRARLRWPDAAAPGGQVDVQGVTLPGLPAVVVGSNGHVAWGFTNSYGDYADWALETPCAASGAARPGATACAAVDVHRERIAVARGESVELEVRETRWGPVLHELDDGRLLSLRWTAHLPGAVDLGLAGFARVADLDQALALADRTGIPTQNLVLGDRHGRIAWRLLGPLPVRADGCNPVAPTPLADARDEPAYDGAGEAAGCTPWPVASNASPLAASPGHDRLWTANARVAGGDDLARIGDGGYDLGARASRIRDLLQARGRFTEADLLAIQLDDRAVLMNRWRELLRALADEGPTLRMLAEVAEDWEGRASPGSAGYRVVRAWRLAVHERLRDGLLAPARAAMGERFEAPSLRQFEGVAWPLVRQRPAHLLPVRFATWGELFEDAARQVHDELTAHGPLHERTWGERNTAAICHPLARSIPLGRRLLCMPPDPLPGDSMVPRVQGPAFGASERMVVAPGHETDGILHMPGGQSGHPLSPFWGAGHDDWVQGRATPFLPGPPRHTLALRP